MKGQNHHHILGGRIPAALQGPKRGTAAGNPRMALGICHDGGITWDLKWCPHHAAAPASDASGNRTSPSAPHFTIHTHLLHTTMRMPVLVPASLQNCFVTACAKHSQYA